MILVQTGCAYDVNNARLGRQRREFDRRLRGREIKDPIRARNDRESVATDRHAHLAAAGKQPRVLTDCNRIWLFDRAGKVGARRLAYDFNEDTAHASSRSGYDQPHVAHDRSPRGLFPTLSIIPSGREGKCASSLCRHGNLLFTLLVLARRCAHRDRAPGRRYARRFAFLAPSFIRWFHVLRIELANANSRSQQRSIRMLNHGITPICTGLVRVKKPFLTRQGGPITSRLRILASQEFTPGLPIFFLVDRTFGGRHSC